MKAKIKKVTINRTHVLTALEGYLKAMTMIDDNDTVTEFIGFGGNEYTVIVEKEQS